MVFVSVERSWTAPSSTSDIHSLGIHALVVYFLNLYSYTVHKNWNMYFGLDIKIERLNKYVSFVRIIQNFKKLKSYYIIVLGYHCG